jgi:hypothetical protein
VFCVTLSCDYLANRLLNVQRAIRMCRHGAQCTQTHEYRTSSSPRSFWTCICSLCCTTLKLVIRRYVCFYIIRVSVNGSEMNCLVREGRTYKEPSIISRTDAAIWLKTDFGPTGHHHIQSSTLPRVCAVPRASASF